MYKESENPAAAAPVVSVVVPAYRCASRIGETIKSVLCQTYPNFEVVVVNDGCPETEALEHSLAPYLDRINYIKQSNSGAAIARNRGVAASSGELIAFLDGDDVWACDYLAEQISFLNSGGFAMVYCDADLVRDDGPLGRTFMQMSPSNGEVTVASLLDLSCHVITSGTVIRRSAYSEAGGFEDARVLSEDFHLWVRVARSGARIGCNDRVLLRYRVSEDGLSGDEVSRVERAIDVFRRLERDIYLSAAEKAILQRRVKGFTTDLAIARGKSHLAGGENRKAAAEFAKAASRRPTAKIAAAAVLSLIAPKSLRRGMKSSPFSSEGQNKAGERGKTI